MKRIALAIMVVSGCAGHSDQESEFFSLLTQAKSVCEVIADSKSYVGQRLVIKGIYFSEPHGRLLYDDKCPQLRLKVSHSLQDADNPTAEAIVERFRKKHPTVRIPVIYSAALASRVVISGCTEPNCYEYSLQDAQLLAASPRNLMPHEK